LIFKFGGAPEIFTSAMSIPSADVPDIIPRTSFAVAGMNWYKEIFNTEDREYAGKKTGTRGKR
jgi:hypothetical protein